MNAQTRKRRGRASEQAVAAAMRSDGWPYAEAVGAGRQGADVTGTPGMAVEVKARRGLSLGAWLGQAVRQTDDGEVPILVVRLDGQGPGTVDTWPAVLPFDVLRRLLRLAGYGDPIEPPTPAKAVPDPAREPLGKGEDFDYWLPTSGGRDWLACFPCAKATKTGTDPRDVVPEVHGDRCPYGVREEAA